MAAAQRPQHRCRGCQGAGRVGQGWLSSGNVCLACEGAGYTVRPQRSCTLCQGRGQDPRQWRLLGGGACPACQGAAYVSKKQRACRVCLAEGTVGGVWRRQPCTACHGRCYLHGRQRPCALCRGQGRLPSPGWFAMLRPRYALGGSHSHVCDNAVLIWTALGGRVAFSITCPACQGAKMVTGQQFPCRRCQATGKSPPSRD
jgi:DnaJ-class molecular chaperone